MVFEEKVRIKLLDESMNGYMKVEVLVLLVILLNLMVKPLRHLAILDCQEILS